jgi:hypothetical protein
MLFGTAALIDSAKAAKDTTRLLPPFLRYCSIPALVSYSSCFRNHVGLGLYIAQHSPDPAEVDCGGGLDRFVVHAASQQLIINPLERLS